MQQIDIRGTIYPVHFGLSAVKNFAVSNGMTTVDDLMAFIAGLDQLKISDLDLISKLLLEGIRRGCKLAGEECDLDADDILDMTTESPETFQALMTALIESFQRSEPQKTPAKGKKKAKS